MKKQTKSFLARMYEHPPGSARNYVIEVHPETGTWSPFFIAIPIQEKTAVNPSLLYGPSGLIPAAGLLFTSGESQSDNGKWFILYAPDAATPTQSYFLFCDQVPSQLAFGVHNGRPQYKVDQLL